ncbi:class I SAM-dependent methyltransferase [Criblamydia sequanensis]|uniref:Protein kinase domain-containing protein n=1 Tax=Candidatus Criblamydia sequanensis CRIB-18 TaxID=1437425 RepID=A0A090DWU1_9BACT|nr:class I SAM-dependent methyltransferase [Criblamydia sequanensis]CDR33309.1 hypothetical protein CSEC_0472 [Criblamydia sequanensis CRIB-18]
MAFLVSSERYFFPDDLSIKSTVPMAKPKEEDLTSLFLASFFNLKNLDLLDQNHIYGHEVQKRKYKKISRNKNFQKSKTKITLPLKKYGEISQVSFVLYDRRVFKSEKLQNEFFVKIKFINEGSKYLCLNEETFVQRRNYFQKLDQTIVEIKRKRDRTAAFSSQFWSRDWIEKVSNSYEKIDRSIEQAVFEFSRNKEKIHILEICGGNGRCARRILSGNSSVHRYTLIELDSKSTEEAKENLKSFREKVEIHQEDVLKMNLEDVISEPPDFIIASGALTTLVFNNPYECKIVLKKMIASLREGGRILLTGLMPEHVSLSQLLYYSNFKVLSSFDNVLNKEFIIIEKLPPRTKLSIRKGKIDFFEALHSCKPRPSRLKEALDPFTEKELREVKSVDLSVLDLDPFELTELRRFPRLKTLSLGFTKNVSQLLSFIPHECFESLETLHLEGTDLKEKDLESLFLKLHAKKLNLLGCPNISPEKAIDYTLKAALNGLTLDLSFLSHNSYTEKQIESALESLFLEEMVPSKVIIPLRVLERIRPLLFKRLASFLIMKKTRFIMDAPFNQETKDRINESQLSKFVKNLNLPQKNNNSPFLPFKNLTPNEQDIFKAIWKMNSGLKLNQIKQIVLFVERQVKSTFEGFPKILRKEDYHLPRDLEVAQDGSIRILLKLKKVPPIGCGISKVVKYALSYPREENRSSEYLANFTVNQEKFPKVIKTLQKVYDLQKQKRGEGLACIQSLTSYINKKGKNKCLVTMPYYANGSLKEYLLNNKQINDPKSFFVNVLRGIHSLHQLGLVHGDIHSGNLLVDCEGQVFVADFDKIRGVRHLLKNPINLNTAPELLEALAEAKTLDIKVLIEKYRLSQKIDSWMAGLLFTNIVKTFNKALFAASNPLSCLPKKGEEILERMQEVKPENRISVACALKEFEELELGA